MKQKLFTLFTLVLCVCTGAWANQTDLIENVTLPDMPTTSLDLSSQTTYTPDANGWIVFDPYNIANNPTWWKVTSKSDQTSGKAFDPTSTSTTAPFVAKASDASCIKINSNGTIAAGIRFTGAEKASFLVNARAGGSGKDIYISLFSFANEIQTLVVTKTALGNVSQEVYFDGLTVGTTYIAYIYNTVSQNSSLMEIALKAPVSNPPGAISFSPAAGSVAAGASVTLTSSDATTIEYQWGGATIGEGGDWSGAVTYSGENKPVVPAVGSTNTVLSVKATNTNGSTYGSASYTPVKMALKTIYSFADGIGSQEVAAADAEITGTTEMKLANTSGRIKLTPATGKFENGDAIEFSGSVGNISRDYGIKYGPNTSIDKGNLYVEAGLPCRFSGTLTLDEATNDLYIGRYGGTTTYFNTFTVRRLVAATSEAFAGVKIGGSAATEDVDYTIDGSTITLTGTFTVEPNVALVNHIVFADESVEDQNLLVAFGAPNGEFFTGTVTIDGTTYTVKAPCGQINALKVEYKDGETTVKEEHIDVTGLKVGASYTVPFRMYVEKDGALYQTTKNGSNPYYGDAVTLAFNTTVTKTVTPVDLGGGTLVLLEDLDDTDEQSAGDRASNCSAYNNKAYSSSVTLSPGIYTFIVKAQNKGRGSSVKVGDTTAFTIENVNANKGAWTDKTFTNVAIPAAGNVTLAKGGSNTIDCYDIIIAIQTGDAPVSTTATTTAAGKGWATLYTPWPLDFANATPATLKAYTATLEGTTVTLTEVPTVPAGTGVVLKSSTTDKNTEYSIPVIASSSIEKGSMMGYTSDTHLNASTAYILNINGDGKAQFFINDDGIIAARKAYLPVGTNPAKALSVVFADDMTGITNANAAEEAAQPAKRIVNGQLVIEKNGKRYNAAGAEF